VPVAVLAIGALAAAPAGAAVIYNNLTPNNQIGIATRPGAGTFEIEAADDFILTGAGVINSAAFTGLLVPPPTGGSVSITDIVIEIYRVFPADSDTTRTPNVITRVNSPSDVAFDSRESGTSLTFSTSVLLPTFTALNSVAPGGIHPAPNQTTGDNGPIPARKSR